MCLSGAAWRLPTAFSLPAEIAKYAKESPGKLKQAWKKRQSCRISLLQLRCPTSPGDNSITLPDWSGNCKCKDQQAIRLNFSQATEKEFVYINRLSLNH